jgi:hypothetical protein
MIVHHYVPANARRKFVNQVCTINCPRPRLWLGQAQRTTLLAINTRFAALGRDQTIKDGSSNIEALRGFFALALVLERRKLGEPADFHIRGFQFYVGACVV